MDTKRCTACGEEKPLDGFHRAAKSKDGVTTRCKECSNIYTRAYYTQHQARAVERARQYRADNAAAIKAQRASFREANGDHLREQYRAFYQRHPDSRRAVSLAWYEAHKEEALASFRQYDKTHKAERKAYIEANRDAIEARQLAYRAIHKEQMAISHRAYADTEQGREVIRMNSERRRARQLGAVGADYTTTAMVRARCELWGNRCYVCGAPMGAVDHVKPLAKGGPHLPCNLRPICKSCNSKKRDKWPYEPALRRMACAI